MKKLKIAQLSTPFISVPPQNYGGTELVVHNITEELVKRGHEVTLFAPGDSKTQAKLVSVYEKSLTPLEMEKQFSPLALKLFWMHSLPTLMHAILPFEKAREFDIIHNHIHYVGLLYAQLIKTPTLHTYHGDFTGALQSPIEKEILDKYKTQPWTAISETQKKNCSLDLNFVSVIHHGVPLEKFEFNKSPGDYLVWLGRITAKKGVKEAIQVAKLTNKKLIIAGVIHPRDQNFYESEIEPQIDNKLIFFKGGLDFIKKVELLKNARILLYPVSWEEPFGLVMVEAMATGTPVIGLAHGAVKEIIQNNETGFLISDTDDKIARMVESVKKIYDMDQVTYEQMRYAGRKRVEENFTVEKMVDNYEKVYYSLIKN